MREATIFTQFLGGQPKGVYLKKACISGYKIYETKPHGGAVNYNYGVRAMGFFSKIVSVVFDRKRLEGYVIWRPVEAVAKYAYRKGRAAMKEKGSKSTSKSKSKSKSRSRSKSRSTARRTGTNK